MIGKTLEYVVSIKQHDDINNIDFNSYIPKFMMLSNGIYFDEVTNYITKIFEYLDGNIIEEIKGNFIRATTHQTGIRMKENEDNIFKPGSKGNITIAGGSKQSRERIINLLGHKADYPVYDMGIEYRKIEFDKALINLSLNAVQLSFLFDDEDTVRSLNYGDLTSDIKMRDMCKKIVRTMVSIGVKTGIYKNGYMSQKQLIDLISQKNLEYIEEKSKKDNIHICSSIATMIERNRQVKSKNEHFKIPPLEENIISYIINLSNENNLVEEKKVIEELRDSILKVCKK